VTKKRIYEKSDEEAGRKRGDTISNIIINSTIYQSIDNRRSFRLSLIHDLFFFDIISSLFHIKYTQYCTNNSIYIG